MAVRYLCLKLVPPLLLVADLLLWGPAQAATASLQFSDPVVVARYADLVEELRCPKCQNQNLADSDAIISQDLRRQVGQLLQQGYSDTEIKDYMVQRYGDFILYDPPLKRTTLLLWFAPLLLLLLGAAILLWLVWGRKQVADNHTLSLAEEARLAALLKLPDGNQDHALTLQESDDA